MSWSNPACGYRSDACNGSLTTSVIFVFFALSPTRANLHLPLVEQSRNAASREDELGMNQDEVKFYDALANNESAVMLLTDETL